MKKQFFLFSIALLPLVALSNEPSAYGGNDISSPSSSTYSITSSENKVISETPKTIQPQNENIVTDKVTSSSQNSEEYEGMRSVIDGYATKIAKQDERIRQLEEDYKKLQDYVQESRNIQNDNQEKVKAVVTELGSLIDSINKNYVPKDKFDQLANEVHNGKTSSKTSTPDVSKKETSKEKSLSPKDLSKKDSATLLKEADTLYDKKAYADAQVLYGELMNRNYKPAKVSFTMGEISLAQKSYSAAIEQYKTSMALYDKASYTPTLLYHTGYAFEKLGKTKEAQNFYKALKTNYPNSPEAKKIK